MRSLIPFLWHANPLELRLRVIAALVLLVIALIANVYVPILYKGAVDALTPRGQEMLVLPLALIFAYALVRFMAAAGNEIRDAIFAKVTQRAVRRVATQVFRHLPTLGRRFPQIGRASRRETGCQ